MSGFNYAHKLFIYLSHDLCFNNLKIFSILINSGIQFWILALLLQVGSSFVGCSLGLGWEHLLEVHLCRFSPCTSFWGLYHLSISSGRLSFSCPYHLIKYFDIVESCAVLLVFIICLRLVLFFVGMSYQVIYIVEFLFLSFY